jgi:hypothetical protein
MFGARLRKPWSAHHSPSQRRAESSALDPRRRARLRHLSFLSSWRISAPRSESITQGGEGWLAATASLRSLRCRRASSIRVWRQRDREAHGSARVRTRAAALRLTRQRLRHARALPGFRHPLTPDAASASVAATCTPRVIGADFTVAITCYRLQDAHVLEAPLAGATALVAVASTTTKHFATTSQTFYGGSIDGPVTAHARAPPSSILLGSRARASRRTPSDAQRELVSRTRRRSLD